MEHRLPNNLNVRLDGIEGESMILMLDMEGICVSSGSACTTGSLEPSHVLLGLGIPQELAHGSLRVTLGRSTTAEHIDHFVKVFPPDRRAAPGDVAHLVRQLRLQTKGQLTCTQNS